MVSAEKSALDGRELHRHPAQSIHAARGTGAGRKCMGRIHYGSGHPVRGGSRCRISGAQLAPLGKRRDQKLYERYGGHV